MGRSVTQKLIESHLVEGEMTPGTEIGLRVDQTLTQDATGTVVMLELEAMHQARCAFTDDHKEAVAAFVEKRRPVFKGR